NSATVHLTQMVNNEVKKLHLCEQCAAESGLDVNSAVSISDVLLGLGSGRGGGSEKSARVCPTCHMRLEDFRKTSRMGCQHCYTAFQAELLPLLEAMHRGHQHIGKKPAGAAATVSLRDLRQALNTAVAAERYEEAAELRDRIRALESKPPAG
ncbi:MAG: UvrB/UvrC motif-containing protein, partial [Kiritimatiellia bacterium]